MLRASLRKNCLYSELFWSAFPRIRTEYGEIRSICPYSVQMRENADQNNYEYVHFSSSVDITFLTLEWVCLIIKLLDGPFKNNKVYFVNF